MVMDAPKKEICENVTTIRLCSCQAPATCSSRHRPP